MERPTSYTEVSRRFPTHVAEAVADLRRGKSKLRLMDPKDMKWEFHWATRIRSHGIADLLSGKAQADDEAEDAKSAEESAKDEIKNTLVKLVCKAGHGRGYSKSKMKVPREIAAEIRKRHIEAKKEQEIADNLSPQEREAEIRKLLSQLGPGVIGIQVGPQGARAVDPLKALGDALREEGAEEVPVSKTDPKDIEGVPSLQDEVQRMAGELGMPPLNFEGHKELQGLVMGKALTYGELRKAAAEKRPVWCRYKEHGEDGYRVNEANYVEIQKDGKGREYANFDNGSSFCAGDIEIEGFKDDEIVSDDGCGEGVFEVFEAKQPGLDLKAVRDKIIGGEKDFLRQMLANVPSHVPPEAVQAVKDRLQSLEDGTIDVQVQKVKRTTIDDLLNADLDTLSANFQAHARKKLKGRDGPPLGR